MIFPECNPAPRKHTHIYIYTHLMKPINDTLEHRKALCWKLADSKFMLFDFDFWFYAFWSYFVKCALPVQDQGLSTCEKKIMSAAVKFYCNSCDVQCILQSFSCQVDRGCLGVTCTYLVYTPLNTSLQQKSLHVTLCLKEGPANRFAPLLFSSFFHSWDRTSQ